MAKAKDKKDNKYEVQIKPHLEDIKRYISCGVSEQQIYNFYEISKTQWWRYKQTHPELENTIAAAKEKLKADLVCKAYQVACGYTITDEKTLYAYDDNGKEVKVSRSVQKREIRPDANMIMWLLINRFPKEFARDPQVLELKKNAQKQSESNGKVEGI